MKKKIAGLDRPYKFWEFQNLVEKIAREEKVEGFEILDYFHATSLEREKEITDIEFDCISETCYGGCEGIYTDLVFWKNGERIRFAVAKTLCEKEEDFLKMSMFGAKLVLIVRKYISEHEKEFNWRGFDVSYEKDGKNIPYMYCGGIDHAKNYANELTKKGYKAFIRDNSTRKFVKF